MKSKKIISVLLSAIMLGMCFITSSCAENADSFHKRKDDDDDDYYDETEVFDETDVYPQHLVIEVENFENTVPSVELTEPPVTEPVIDYGYEAVYLDVINNLSSYTFFSYDGTSYDLLYLDEDNIPELVIENMCDIFIFSYSDGVLHPFENPLIYGAGGNHGYVYLPYSNLIENSNADYAGACVWTSYLYINENYSIVWNEVSLHAQAFPEGVADPWDYINNQWDGETWFYYIGDTEVTMEEYIAASHNDEDWYWLGGYFSREQITNYLTTETAPEPCDRYSM